MQIFINLIFQKDSPYLEDANKLIERAREGGFIDAQLKKHAPHAKECLTHANVEKSHFLFEERFPLKLENIYGMLILLAAGLAGGAVTLIAEVIIHGLGNLKSRSAVKETQGSGVQEQPQPGPAPTREALGPPS